MIADLSSWLVSNPVGPRPMGQLPLTTAERVFAWINPDQGTTTAQPAQLEIMTRLVRAVSGLCMNYMNRDTLARVNRVDTYPASRTGRIVLRNWPVLAASSVSAPPAPAMATSLWSLEPYSQGAQRIIANASAGGNLLAGPDGISVSYQTGYVRTEEVVVPSASPYTVETQDMLLVSEGVVRADGTTVDPALYTVSGTTYTFDATLAGADLTLVYSHVPSVMEQAVIEECALAYRSRQRIGEMSKALPNGGGTSKYTPRAISEITRQALNNDRRVVPS